MAGMGRADMPDDAGLLRDRDELFEHLLADARQRLATDAAGLNAASRGDAAIIPTIRFCSASDSDASAVV